MTQTRTATYIASTYTSETIHAASRCKIRLYHVLACNGRAVVGNGWQADPERVTCKACRKAIAAGRIVWA